MNDEKNFNNVKNMFKLKDENILLKYSTTDIITHDYIPYIGELKQNMFISCGYNTWGMTNSIMGAKIISDLITKKVNEYRDLFNPKRFNIANIIKLPIFIFNGLKSYMSSKLIKNKSWYKENIKIKNKIGVVTDELGKTHKIINKCPHAGCSLIWNEVEKTWDCPCHASRYDIDGNVIKGPSTKNIKF